MEPFNYKDSFFSNPPHDCEDPSEIERFNAFEEINKSANYNGDWSALLKIRLTNPKIIKLYLANLSEKQTYLANEDVMEQRVKEYLDRVDKVFNQTHIGPAVSFNNQYGLPSNPMSAGQGKFNSPPVVFNDAQQINGSPMSVFQKHVVEAHEQAHGVLNDYWMVNQFRFKFRGLVDDSFMKEFSDEYTAVFEILARMSQLKNYFGMERDEKFTAHHLDYAEIYYSRDTGFGSDNITDLLKAIRRGNRQQFVDIINSAAC